MSATPTSAPRSAHPIELLSEPPASGFVGDYYDEATDDISPRFCEKIDPGQPRYYR